VVHYGIYQRCNNDRSFGGGSCIFVADFVGGWMGRWDGDGEVHSLSGCGCRVVGLYCNGLMDNG
jgi:hypothetical protein